MPSYDHWRTTMPSYDYAVLDGRYAELLKEYTALQTDLSYAKRDLRLMKQALKDLPRHHGFGYSIDASDVDAVVERFGGYDE